MKPTQAQYVRTENGHIVHDSNGDVWNVRSVTTLNRFNGHRELYFSCPGLGMSKTMDINTYSMRDCLAAWFNEHGKRITVIEGEER